MHAQLHGSLDGSLYVTRGRALYRGTPAGGFERLGTLSLARSRPILALEYPGRPIQRVLDSITGRFMTHVIHPVGDSRFVLASGRSLALSVDGGMTWEETGRLPDSSPPFGVLPSAIASRDGSIFVGEYPQSLTAPAGMLVSTDGGWNWERVTMPDIRHIHAVQTDPHSDAVWITTGDDDRAAGIHRYLDGELHRVGGGSQDWRAVELAFTTDAILWGMDCPYAPRKSIFKLNRDDLHDAAPVCVHEVDGSVFYAATISVDGEDVVALSTAVETGADSTAPSMQPHHAAAASVVTASSADGFQTWESIASFSKRRVVLDAVPSMALTANAYVHLEQFEDALVINPYNTAVDDGSLIRWHPDGSVVRPSSVNRGTRGR